MNRKATYFAIHEGGEPVKGSDGSTQYIGGHTIPIEINQHMSHDDFISIVCWALKMSRDHVIRRVIFHKNVNIQ